MFCQQSFFLAQDLSILSLSSHQKWKSLLNGYQWILGFWGCSGATAEEMNPPARPLLPEPRQTIPPCGSSPVGSLLCLLKSTGCKTHPEPTVPSRAACEHRPHRRNPRPRRGARRRWGRHLSPGGAAESRARAADSGWRRASRTLSGFKDGNGKEALKHNHKYLLRRVGLKSSPGTADLGEREIPLAAIWASIQG